MLHLVFARTAVDERDEQVSTEAAKMRWTPRKGLGLFVALLLDVQVLATDGWGGRYTLSTVCGLEGSTVELQCAYWHPTTDKRQSIYTTETWWHTETDWPKGKQPKDLRLDPQYSGRVRVDCQRKKCTLFIQELKESDAGEYRFRFVTSGGRGFSVAPGVTLSVTELSVQAMTGATLKCESKCFPTASPSFIWYKNGEETKDSTTQFLYYPTPQNSYACALRDYEQLASPPVCESRYTSCPKVVYDSRRMCALKGSTVDIWCSYSPYSEVKSRFWYTDQWQPRDLRSDDRYKGRVKFPRSIYGRSTLRINDVTESDSAEYRFKFSTASSEWRGRLPGTNLTVTAAQVQVTNFTGGSPDVIAQLVCHTTCNLEVPLSFCWFVNAHQVGNCEPSQTAKPRQITLSPGDYVTCQVERNPFGVSSRLYALAAPSVSASHSGDGILKGQRLTLTCTVNPSASCTYGWFKETGNSGHQKVSDKPALVIPSIKASDSADYFCTVANELGEKQSERIKVNVKYPPEDVALEAIPSAVPSEGQSVSLKCSNGTNPKARYAFYKDNERVGREPGGFVNFSSIRPEDAGNFHCQACNEYGCVNSTKVLLDVEYGPRLPKVSATYSGSVGVGSWVSLTCSSDANPSASYIWYHENSRKSDMAVFNISDYRAELHGEYRCQAWNRVGNQSTTLWLSTEASLLKVMTVVRVLAGLLLLVLILGAALLHRKTMAAAAQPNASAEHSTGGPDEPLYSTGGPDELLYSTGGPDELLYSTGGPDELAFSEPDAIYSNVARAERRRSEDRDEGVEDIAVNCRPPGPGRKLERTPTREARSTASQVKSS
ncbi:sialoadhesin-like isoform X1 [Syngnathus typhle]|uniref:sialoadhesin-like isoform X1 n=1 Tax=Syngnathus typhle TaxID=161592 RepID=UPI002A69FBA6|nr:sialoadhesin-like isoform X1 [Syngnathus typhle]